MEIVDFHTHNLDAPPGKAIINIPLEWMIEPTRFNPRPNALYSAGIHPWWTGDLVQVEAMLKSLSTLLAHPQVVAVGECGLDTLRGAGLKEQGNIFLSQVALAEQFRMPMTLHIVHAFDRLLRLHKMWQPTTQWTVHGFRGKPALAKQLLDSGLNLSFGRQFNSKSFEITPPDRRHRETDDN